MRVTPTDLAGLAVGAALGKASAAGVRRLVPSSSTQLLALTLVPVALIYPAARKSVRGSGAAVLREVTGVAAMTAVAAASRQTTRPEVVTAAGWLAHAGFDALHGTDHSSRIPGWYPALCAGYDVAVAADLLATRR